MDDKPTDVMIELPVIGKLTYGEWHAVVDGILAGLREPTPHRGVEHKRYWSTGYILQMLLKYILFAIIVVIIYGNITV